MKYPPKRKDFTTIQVDESPNKSNNFGQEVSSYVHSQLTKYKTQREEREEIWIECWAMYFSNRYSMQELRKNVYKSAGDIKTDWRHRINPGKGYELVETVLAHLINAFFPNNNWFSVTPTAPGYDEYSMVIQKLADKKLEEANFRVHFEVFLRQLLVTGNSIMALPWRTETIPYKTRVKIQQRDYSKGSIKPYGQEVKYQIQEEERVVYNAPQFETLDVFDFYWDSKATCIEESNIIRRVIRKRQDVVELIDSNYYKMDKLNLVNTKAYYYDDNKQRLKLFEGVTIPGSYSWNDEVEILEFWGDCLVAGIIYKDVVITIIGDHVVRFENNPYWTKPFVLGTYTPIHRSVNSLGIIEPTLGLLHQLNIITNQRLDNLELSVNTMWEHVNDGTLQPEEIFTEPGKVFNVSQQNTIVPIQTPNNFTISYQEAQFLEQIIDKNSGTGNLISANQSRDAERVTAAEVQATRDAGGNRLSAIHRHIERTSLLEILNKLFRLFQQFIVDDEIVRLPDPETNEVYHYVQVGADELQYEFVLKPVGTDHITDTQFELEKYMTFLSIVGQNETMSQAVDFRKLLEIMTKKLGLDEDIDKIIKKEEEPQQLPGQQIPGQQLPPEAQAQLQQQAPPQDLAGEVSQELGHSYGAAVQANIQADGGQNLMKQMFGL